MKTMNSLSGGKTSSYLAVKYPADYNVFALVTTDDEKLKFKDEAVRKIVSDKIGREFIGTLEEDTIVYTMLDLEQMIGREINWVTGWSFDRTITNSKGYFLPNVFNRFCTYRMKLVPIQEFWRENINEPIEIRLGFRANEMSRATNMLKRCSEDGFIYEKFKVGIRKDGKNKWQKMKYQKPSFPLIDDGVYKDQIEEFWRDKPVRFAYMNNCIGCFHRNEVLLNHMSNRHPEKFNWFVEAEQKSGGCWKKGITYTQIGNHKMQHELFDEDFNSCDSGYCGL
jgi:3'-phosphoadenosine 5'-phosphosulfate sulfotransferase (PAPS reductase)/FAD synthetase